MSDKVGRISRYDHIGKMFGVFDLLSVCSPFVKILLPAECDPQEMAEVLTERITKAFTELPEAIQIEWGLYPPKVTAFPSCRLIRSKEEEARAFYQKVEEIRTSCEEQAKKREKNVAGQEPNFGFWVVEGVRHSALVKADSASQAIEKASREVFSWELPTARFIGKELPEVLGI